MDLLRAARVVRSLVVALVIAAGATASADSLHLAEARKAVDEVRYDDAQKLLVAAIQDGTNSPAVLMAVEHSLVKPNDLSKLGLAFFTINGVISVIIGTLGILDVLL